MLTSHGNGTPKVHQLIRRNPEMGCVVHIVPAQCVAGQCVKGVWISSVAYWVCFRGVAEPVGADFTHADVNRRRLANVSRFFC
jgi:hypothetical protein